MKKQTNLDKLTNNKLTNHFNKIQAVVTDWDKQEKELKNYPLYSITIDELKHTEKKLLNTQKELETLKTAFRKMYEGLQPKSIEKLELPKTYSFNCEYSGIELRKLHSELSVFFDCDIEDFINVFSESITTQINIKKDVSIVDAIRVFSELYNNRKAIRNKNWQSIIYNSECLFKDNQPLKVKQIKNAVTTLKQSCKTILN